MTEAVFTAKDKANLETLTEEIPKIREILEGFPKLVSHMESLEETLEILSDKEECEISERHKKMLKKVVCIAGKKP